MGTTRNPELNRLADRAHHVWVRPEHSNTSALASFSSGAATASEGEWQGLVTYVEPHGRVVTDWLLAEQLQPVVPAAGSG
jgi:hypothetical protein